MKEKKILILGANGMIGHKVYQVLSKYNNDVWVHFRTLVNLDDKSLFHDKSKIIDGLDLSNFKELEVCLNSLMPDIIINAAGITIRRGVNESLFKSILLNSVLPNFLNIWVVKNNKRLLHFSTDCVFSGKDGSYDENSNLDAQDVYGKTKGLGEVISNNSLTIRGSMIGRELENKTELLEWFLSKKKDIVNGYTNVIYSGITTLQMAYFINEIIFKFPNMNGLFNVASKPITKYDLLILLNKHFNNQSIIIKDETYISKKNLIAQKFYNTTNFCIPEWEDMIIELKKDSDTNYKHYNN
jgi:dTDP-4-dehydrorhamnose reductase